MKKTWLLVMTAALVLFAAGACGSRNKTPEADTPAPRPAATATTQAAPDEASEPLTASSEPQATGALAAEDEAEVLSLDSRDTGLEGLKSYRMKWRAEWTSTEQGETESGSWDWTEEYASDPEALHWTWSVADSKDTSHNTYMEIWQIDNTMYMKTAGDEESCTSFSSEDESNQISKGIFSPNMLGSVSDAHYVGTEEVNGIPAKHYKYDESATSLFGAGKVSGEIWVAVDGGFVVKDTVNWSGGAGFFGSGSDENGEGKWEWELSDVDQPIEIMPPENCGGAANELPALPDASEKASFGDTFMYKTASELSEAAEFYKMEMPAAGWQPEGEPFEMEGMATQEYTREGEKASVVLTSDGEGAGTQVMISVTKE